MSVKNMQKRICVLAIINLKESEDRQNGMVAVIWESFNSAYPAISGEIFGKLSWFPQSEIFYPTLWAASKTSERSIIEGP